MIWIFGVRYWQFSTSAPVWTFHIEQSVQDLANSVLIKLRQSAECESLVDASRLGILKNKPRHILAFKFMSLLFWCFGSAEPHRYFIDCFVCSLLNIKLVFRYNQIVFQIHFPLYFPLTYPLFTHFHFHYKIHLLVH